jgi:hypothetical protein
MIFLTLDAAIFNEFAGGAYLQIGVASSRDTTRRAHLIGLYAAHGLIDAKRST